MNNNALIPNKNTFTRNEVYNIIYDNIDYVYNKNKTLHIKKHLQKNYWFSTILSDPDFGQNWPKFIISDWIWGGGPGPKF